MPLTLITALPGGGKSTYLVDHYEKLRISEDRPVYYYNIDDLKLPWSKIEDPDKWNELPPNSIVIIDECQDVFPVLKQGQVKPEKYQLLSKHRKLGLDLVLVTQHPNFVDAYVRKLVQHHVHFKRVAGYEKSMMYTSINGVMDVDKGLKKASRSIYKFPPETFGLHKSAEAHTIKKKFPFKVLILPLILTIGAALAYKVYASITKSDIDSLLPGTDKSIDFNSSTSSVPQLPTHQKIIPHRKINVITHGVFERMTIHLVGEIQDTKYFKIDGITFPERHLVKLGYQITRIDDCLLKMGNSIITCPPEVDLRAQQIQHRDRTCSAGDASYQAFELTIQRGITNRT